jgi:hypothetical protein
VSRESWVTIRHGTHRAVDRRGRLITGHSAAAPSNPAPRVSQADLPLGLRIGHAGDQRGRDQRPDARNTIEPLPGGEPSTASPADLVNVSLVRTAAHTRRSTPVHAIDSWPSVGAHEIAIRYPRSGLAVGTTLQDHRHEHEKYRRSHFRPPCCYDLMDARIMTI